MLTSVIINSELNNFIRIYSSYEKTVLYGRLTIEFKVES